MTDDPRPTPDPDPEHHLRDTPDPGAARPGHHAGGQHAADASGSGDTEAPRSIYTSLDGTPYVPPAGAPDVFGGDARPTQGGIWATAAAAAAEKSEARAAAAAHPAGPQAVGGRPYYVLSSWGARFGAWIVDGLLFGSIALAAATAGCVALGLTVTESVQFLTGQAELPSSVKNEGPFALVLLGQVVLQVGLIVWAMWEGRGQTPGKKLLRIRMVTADGSPLTLGLVFRREALVKTLPLILLGGIAAVVPGFALLAVLVFLANYLWPLWDDERRAIHDMIVETRVVREPRDAPADPHTGEQREL